ncbi:unnamed protein product [Cyclocybe aegerita]|uniref:DUF6589 domain-containing protein n=1 Tax=Cyclocybe aegerita TaxID=1973307 RepID=A0A8S0WAI6_CYCAE|nr:unnamed protein product [Cyclocybe aegerita]
MKGQRKRNATLARKKEEQAAQQEEEKAQQSEAEQAKERHKLRFFDDTLDSLSSRGYTLGQLVQYVSDPTHSQGQAHWESLFRDRKSVPSILELWATKGSTVSKEQVHTWAVDFMSEEVKQEAQRITESGYLQTLKRKVDSTLVLNLDLKTIYAHLTCNGSIFMNILQSLATLARQLKSAPIERMAKKIKVVTSAALSLLGEYSYNNNWPKKVIGLYMYSTGSQRQPLSVMSHLGLSESYDAITGKQRRKKKKAATSDALPLIEELLKSKAGTLHQLSRSMVDAASAVASTGLFATLYDNINMVFRAAEQIVGRTDAQENGTCATIWPLWKARLEDMKVEDLTSTFDQAPLLSIHDFGDDLARTLPVSDEKIELNKTPLHPLPAMDIDESTIIGGAKVVETIFDILGIRKVKGWLGTIKFFCGDQLTITRLRALVNIRAGHEGGYSGFGWGVWMPGLFHAKMADVHGCLLTHWGKPSAGTRNPGCLAFHNTVLQHKPITITSPPPFRTCRDLIFVSLYARVLHCLLLVSKKASLKECLEDLTWAQLELYSTEILEKFGSADIVSELRQKRKQAAAKLTTEMPVHDGDMVFENAVLFFCDALLSLLKTWALSFQGSGRTKYAHEMLHLIHNLTHVWPREIRNIVLNNWLINPTGNPNSWIEVDLMQEHMNFWIKNFYRAHGSSASWEWLEMVAPCVEILRQLACGFKQMLGSDLGTAHHPMDLSHDLPDLMDSLEDHEVYIYKKGRYLDEDDAPAVDIISSGLKDLLKGKESPLVNYNDAFHHLQARRRLKPLVGSESDEDEAPAAQTSLATTVEVLRHSEDPELEDPGSQEDDEESEHPGEFLQEFEDGNVQELSLESAADVCLDMDAEDLATLDRDVDLEHEHDSDLDTDEEGGFV